MIQPDVDEWLTGKRSSVPPPCTTAGKWTGRDGMSRQLAAPRPPSGTLNPQALSDDERWRLFADVTSDASIDPHTKFAAGLMLMFGIRAAKIVQLRAEDVPPSPIRR